MLVIEALTLDPRFPFNGVEPTFPNDIYSELYHTNAANDLKTLTSLHA